MEHVLKIRSCYFLDVQSGAKPFEIRKNDRDYKVGDRLLLFEIAEDDTETGQSVAVKVTYILHGPAYGLIEGYCIMGIKLSKRQGRSNTGNRPENDAEALDYANTIGLDSVSALDCLNYYSQTGWKMASGLALADWKAAFRRWKPRMRLQQTGNEEYNKLALLLPMLLLRTAQLAQNKEEVRFRDPHVGAVALHYGFDRLLRPMNSFETNAMVKLYQTSKQTQLAVPSMRSNPHGQGVLQAPSLDEFEVIMKNKASKE